MLRSSHNRVDWQRQLARVVAAVRLARARQRLFECDSPGEIAELLGAAPG